MTLKKIIQQIYEGLSEPSDLPIYSDVQNQLIDQGSLGWKFFVDLVNEASLALATWKFPDGRQIRMRMNESGTFFQTKLRTGTVGTVSGSVMTVTGLADGTDLVAGQLVFSGAASAVVINSDGIGGTTTLLLYKVSGTFNPGDTVSFSLREYLWTDAGVRVQPLTQTGIPVRYDRGSPLEIISITDTETEGTLDREYKYDQNTVVGSVATTPTRYFKIPSGIRFTEWPAEARLYYVRYMRGPRPLAYTDETLSPELPEQFHRAIVLYGLWFGNRRAQESGDAYSVKRDLEDTLLRIRTEYDLQDELSPGQIKFYPNGR